MISLPKYFVSYNYTESGRSSWTANKEVHIPHKIRGIEDIEKIENEIFVEMNLDKKMGSVDIISFQEFEVE